MDKSRSPPVLSGVLLGSHLRHCDWVNPYKHNIKDTEVSKHKRFAELEAETVNRSN